VNRSGVDDGACPVNGVPTLGEAYPRFTRFGVWFVNPDLQTSLWIDRTGKCHSSRLALAGFPENLGPLSPDHFLGCIHKNDLCFARTAGRRSIGTLWLLGNTDTDGQHYTEQHQA